MKLALLASLLCIATGTPGDALEEQEESSLLQLRPMRHDSRVQVSEKGGDAPGAIFPVLPSAAPQPESALTAAGGIYVSYMPVPSPPAPDPVPGRVMRFAGGAATQVIGDLEGNAGLATNSVGNKLYVTSKGAVMEYNLNGAGAELSRTFDVSSHTETVNGLCVSHDDSLLYVTEPGFLVTPYGIIPSGEKPTLLAVDLATGDVEMVFQGEPGQSPNGCFVHPHRRDLVYIINMQHGLSVWDRKKKSAKKIRWAANLPGILQARGNQYAGDGLVLYKKKLYVSLWRYVLNEEGSPVQSGNIYACRIRKRDCDLYAADIAAADIQLGMGMNGPMLLAPDLIGGPVNGVRLPRRWAERGKKPQILSAIWGLPRCFGVPDLATGREWGCPIVTYTDCDGEVHTELGGGQLSPPVYENACQGQGVTNSTAQDSLPITFNWPVDVSSLRHTHFQFNFADGTSNVAQCAIPQGGPANEPNEVQTIAVNGNAGGWGELATEMEIVGDLMLWAPDGSRVSAKGLKYSGRSMQIENGPFLLTADLERFSTDGEFPSQAGEQYPNHCQVNFPETTHRIRLLFNGGVTYDGTIPITPDRTDLFQLKTRGGKPFPDDAFLGIADLGSTMPRTQCEKDTYNTDGDNYVDLCLKLGRRVKYPRTVHLPCDEGRTLVVPKGVDYPCQAQTVKININW